MALLQGGMHVGRAVLLVGVGLATPAVLRSGKVADILGDLQEVLRDKGAVDVESGTDDFADAVAQLTREVREFASAMSVTVVQVDPSTGATSPLVVPAAAVGAVSYCYLWWKGISLSSLMYVTKRNMADAVASMTKHLEQVQSSLAAAKKHLTQRIQHVDDKLEQQKEISGQIKDEVTGARLRINSIGSDMDKIKNLVVSLDEKVDTIEAKQNYSCAAVDYLCRFIKEGDERRPERLEGLPRTVRRFGGDNLASEGLGFGQLLAIESANPGAGRILRSTVINSARLILP